MNKKHKRESKKREKNFLSRKVLVKGVILIAIIICSLAFFRSMIYCTPPDELLVEYMNHIEKKEYKEMYEMIDADASEEIRQEDFIKRNSAIYEGIGIENMSIKIISYKKKEEKVAYQTSFDTAAGTTQFRNEAVFKKTREGYKLIWDDSMIFPELTSEDKVRISTERAQRGQILDRDGKSLARQGTASSVGIVPGKLNDREKAVKKIADLLEIEPETIEKKLSAKWVKDDSFVPIKTIPKIDEMSFMSAELKEDESEQSGLSGEETKDALPELSEEEMESELSKLSAQQERQKKLLAISGVMMVDTEVREYPLKEAAAHLIGYVQTVTAEDLEEHKGEDYTVDSVIGRSGMEGLFEKELKGQNGRRIYIVDSEGKEKEELACIQVQHGQDVQLTIDSNLQTSIYKQFKEDKSCTVAMDPYTGEVLALVSTPSYDNNDFIMGFTDDQWTALNEDEKNPLYNRFRQVWCPGSTFKSITAAIGLESGAIDPEEDYTNEGTSWQKDTSWGSYYVTTLHTYEPVILKNALIYSDNIYFAKAALKIGAQEMESSLTKLGFGEELPFEITMQKSQYSNSEHIETEIQLADSGYGQGQILINPLHMACIYTAFCNEGNIIKPYLVEQQGTNSQQTKNSLQEAESREVGTGQKEVNFEQIRNDPQKRKTQYWIPNAFSSEVSNRVLEGLEKVVNNPNGTGYGAHRDDFTLAGKTGTAEIKATKEDTSGTELGWFAVFTPDQTVERPILMLNMVEDVKDWGGSSYVVEKDRDILDSWIEN